MAKQLDSFSQWRPSSFGRFRAGTAATTIAVASGKGGVGKSHISLSLAIALSRLGHPVLLLDGDMGLANLHMLAGVAVQRDLGDVLAGRCDVVDALVSLPDGPDLLPSASGVAGLSALPPERIAAIAAGLVSLGASYRFVVVDTGAGIGETTLNLVAASDRALVVSTPEPTAQADAYALLKVALGRRRDLPFSLIVNQCASAEQGREAASRLSGVARRFLGVEIPLWALVPRQPGLEEHALRRVPAMRADSEGPFARSISALALRLAGEPAAEPDAESFFQRLTKAAS